MNKELRPCPFCGETPEIVYLDTNKNKKWFFVMCRGLACGVKVETSKRGSTREEAINLWNHRPIEDGLREQADELETYISKLVYEQTGICPSRITCRLLLMRLAESGRNIQTPKSQKP